MNWKKYSFSLAALFWVFSVWPARAAAPADKFRAANQLYDAGKFAEAAAAYEKLEPKTAHLYYNLGNARFREGKLGLAVLSYERARRLTPRDPDIRANLRFAELRLGVEEVNASPRAIRRFFQNAMSSRTTGEWGVHELAGLWLTLLAVAGAIWLPRMRTGFLVAAALGFGWFAAATTALACQIYTRRTGPAAIVLADKTKVRFAPLPDATVHFPAAEGTRVAIREDRGQWLYIERADGQGGWVQADAVGRVTP